MVALVAACQAPPGVAAAQAQANPEYRAYEWFGEVFSLTRSEYVEPVSTTRLLTLALRGTLGSGAPLPPGAPRIIEDGIKAVAAARDDRTRLEKFGDTVNTLAAGHTARTLLGAAVTGMLNGLNPHNKYIEANMPFPADPAGEPSVGLELRQEGQDTVIVRALPYTPAAAGDVRRGDLLLRIDGKPVPSGRLEDVFARLRGPAGSTVEIVLNRGQPGELVTVRLQRQVVLLETVSSSLHGTVAVIRPQILRDTTPVVVQAAIRARTAEAGGRLSGVVLDLRDNPGGLFDAATATVGLLLPAGAPVVTVRNRAADESKTVQAAGGALPADMPVVVVVNALTAAGAEMMAAALGSQRALLLGSPTYGRGTIETIFHLHSAQKGYGPLEGSKDRILLTTGWMVSPDGSSWQRRGLVPDILVADTPRLDQLSREGDIPNTQPPPTPSQALVSANPWRARWTGLARRLPASAGPGEGGDDVQIMQAIRVVNLLVDPGP